VNSLISLPRRVCAHDLWGRYAFFFFLGFVGIVASLWFTSPIFAVITVNPLPGDDSGTVNTTMSGYVFYDKNHNNYPDPTEYGIDGAAIQLIDTDTNQIIQTAITSQGGYYIFDGLKAGNYALHDATPNSNWMPVVGKMTTLNQGITVTEQVATQASYGWADVGTASIKGITLDAGTTITMCNFAGNNYPIQLVSKRMFLAVTNPKTPNPDKLTFVPEPSTAIMLILGSLFLGFGVALRRHFKI
jgi:hypothetical protein